MIRNAQPFRQRRSRMGRGFTLIELMIVVVIVGVLAAIALPSYTAHVRKGRRVDAKTALLDLAAREERYFAVYNVYTPTLSVLGVSGAAVFSGSSTTSYYTLALSTGGSNTTFAATATPTGAQAVDTCQTYAIDYLGQQTNVNATDTGCW